MLVSVVMRLAGREQREAHALKNFQSLASQAVRCGQWGHRTPCMSGDFSGCAAEQTHPFEPDSQPSSDDSGAGFLVEASGTKTDKKS